jgi:hypothetical protein
MRVLAIPNILRFTIVLPQHIVGCISYLGVGWVKEAVAVGEAHLYASVDSVWLL